MTPEPLLSILIPLVDDLARELPEEARYRRLLQALRRLLPCDATALLRLEGDALLPVAIDGLSADTLGRRFRVADHPRFAVLLAGEGPTRFPATSPLPDPYDGLVLGARLEVHDCLGCPLYLDGRPWGLLTLDALEPGRFAETDVALLAGFASLAAATVRAAQRMDALARSEAEARARADVYSQAASGMEAPRLSGQSAAIRRLQKEIAVVGNSELTVLIGGETGVGKELVAQALHAHSPRAGRLLVSVNCAALPESLVESELFGHVRGAFSGAVGDRRGKFALADGGTLFLDEVGELPLAAQAKLLRVLQGGHLQRLGAEREQQVDVRVIAATNRDLAEEVRQGRFRADLYHRLCAYPLRVPPLRERGRDVLLLAGFFLEQNRARLGLRGLRLAPDAQAALLAYPWPGNVRELEHLVGRAALKALAAQAERPRILSLGALDLELTPPAAAGTAEVPQEEIASGGLREAVERLQRDMIAASLGRHRDNWAAAARQLGVDRANLHRLAKRLGLR
ncbi:nitric oxide reductase transcriptional regulator NorR [Azoarcus sp. TTM-91]|uniref:nitric oxide reductase transcriptional regulator NorR n=1 Tax=Azoarcus sp. TTM-91 TaxID=2691581 RepID=UPI00145C8984|nr:nitric oxide reductase transcriptional regulator NorR [Azoarcus sp. TTM-91]NMG35681.1 nitric oxide reductase transcriptional regulator NorR [Azoarcus sp. TTM-91]